MNQATMPSHTLASPGSEGGPIDIFMLADWIDRHVCETWAIRLEAHLWDLLAEFASEGDTAYGTYLRLLFQPVHAQMKQAGLRAFPRLPGRFSYSREWGSNPEQTDQQRWMWSTIKTADGQALGTIVTITFHDHTQFRITRRPEAFALPEHGKRDVVEALSRRSPEFADAREARIEIAEYLRSLEARG